MYRRGFRRVPRELAAEIPEKLPFRLATRPKAKAMGFARAPIEPELTAPVLDNTRVHGEPQQGVGTLPLPS